MGNHKLRFSDMMPNAWFYKLKDTKKTTSLSSSSSSKPSPPFPPSFVPKRASYYFPSSGSPSHLPPAFEPEPKLRPVLTKPAKKDADQDEKKRRRRSTRRANSPKVRVAVRAHGGARRKGTSGGLGESYAVVKRSSDPRRDFGESMREMIAEHRLTTSADLEELLACYLSLNSDEYHAVIVKAFQEVWFDVANLVTK